MNDIPDFLRDGLDLLQSDLRDARQTRVVAWATAAFGPHDASMLAVRGLRLAEEAIEAAQACAVSVEQIHRLVDYVYGRPVGEIGQELGGVGVTLLALAESAGMSAEQEEVREIRRVLAKPLDLFHQRNLAKNEAGLGVCDQCANPSVAATIEAPKQTAEDVVESLGGIPANATPAQVYGADEDAPTSLVPVAPTAEEIKARKGLHTCGSHD